MFVALELPDPVRERLVAWQDEAGGSREGLSRVARESLHVTLCFIGARPEVEIPSIAQACDVVTGAGVSGLSLGDLIWLPASRRPRVLAVRILDPSGSLASVQARLAGALSALGAYPESGRRFRPHVTVCRVRTGARVGSERLPTAPAVVFDGEQVTLLRSHLGRGPARYESLHAVRTARRL